jgi:hypothetical protein
VSPRLLLHAIRPVQELDLAQKPVDPQRSDSVPVEVVNLRHVLPNRSFAMPGLVVY